MFKRVEKRQKKMQDEEDLGLDDDLKEIMGLQDTDSEESDSDSDVESGDEGSGDEVDDDMSLADDNSDVAEGSEDGEEEVEDPDVSVSNALTDPVYIVSIDPDVKACIVCPGKLLKGGNMVQTHRISKAHERRYKQFKTITVNSAKDESAWVVLKRHAEDNPKLSLAPSVDGISKRGEKKKRYLERQKAKREKVKLLKAKKAAEKSSGEMKPDASSNSGKAEAPTKRKTKEVSNPNIAAVSIVTPPKKRRKVVESSNSGEKSSNQPTGGLPKKTAGQPVKGGGKGEVAEIVRSTANRALAARSKSAGKRRSSKVP